MTNQLKKSVLSGVKWLSISKFLIQLFRWFSTFWVIRQLNSYDYGIVAIACILTDLLSSLNYLSIGNAIIKFKDVRSDILDSLCTFAIIFGLSLALIQYLIAPSFASVYNTIETENILKLLSITYIIGSLSVYPLANLAKKMQFKKLAFIDLTVGIVTPSATLVLAYLGFAYWSLVYGTLIGSFGKLIVVGLTSPYRLKLDFQFKKAKKMLLFGFKNTTSALLAQLNSSVDLMIGGYFFSAERLGFYRVGTQISLIPLRKLSPELRRISFPAYSSISDNPNQTLLYFSKSNRLISLLVFPIFFGIASVSEALVNILITPKWSESIMVIQIISFALPFKLLNETTCSMLNALGRVDILIKNTFLSLLAFVVLIFALLNYDIDGLALSWFISIIISYVSLIIFTKQATKVRIGGILNAFWIPFSSSTIMSLILFWVQSHHSIDSAVELILLVCMGALIYFGLSLLLAKNSLVEMYNLIKK